VEGGHRDLKVTRSCNIPGTDPAVDPGSDSVTSTDFEISL